MPFRLGWLDQQLNIVEVVLTRQLSAAEHNQLFLDFFTWIDDAAAPVTVLVDASEWNQKGQSLLNDPRFKRMPEYRHKIAMIVMVTQDKVTASLGKFAVAAGQCGEHRLHITETREAALQWIGAQVLDLQQT